MENKKIWMTIPIIGVVLLTLVIGIFAFSPRVAASTDLAILTQEDNLEKLLHWKGGFDKKGKFGFGTSFDYDAFIANELGVTVTELQEARQAAKEAALEQAVTEGVITEEQAGLIKASHELKQYIDKEEIFAAALGITTDELKAARQEGKSLPYLFGELGLDPADIKASLQSAYEDAVKQAIDDGVITASQAEQLQEKGFGGRGFGKRGHGFGLPYQKPAPSSDSDL